MGNQSGMGGSKPGRTLPNPNYGSGAGTDNSNGVYNASASAQAAQQPQYDQGLGAGTIGATAPLASPALTPPAGATGATDPNQVAGATGSTTTATAANPNGAAYGTTGAQSVKGQSKGQQLPTMQGAATNVNQALQGGPTGQPPAYSTSYVPPPPATTAAPGASSPMSGSSLTVGDAIGQGKSAKGGTPGAPAGTGGQTGGQTGVAGATGTTAPGAVGATGPRDYAAESGRFNAQNDPTGGYAKMYNQQQAGKAAAATAPDWMKKMFAGTDQFGGTLQQRAEAEQKGMVDNGPTTKDWQTVVKKMTGQSDPWKALQDAYAIANKSGNLQNAENIRRAMIGSGMDVATSALVHDMFSSGSDHQGNARRLGLEQEYLKRTGATQAQKDQAKELADWHKANPTGGGPTGTTGPPDSGGPTGTTGPPDTTTKTPDITQPPNAGGTVTPEEAKATPGLTNDRVNQIARQYMVSPEIAKQIYMQILQQSQSSGGGNGPGGSGGDGGDGSY